MDQWCGHLFANDLPKVKADFYTVFVQVYFWKCIFQKCVSPSSCLMSLVSFLQITFQGQGWFWRLPLQHLCYLQITLSHQIISKPIISFIQTFLSYWCIYWDFILVSANHLKANQQIIQYFWAMGANFEILFLSHQIISKPIISLSNLFWAMVGNIAISF